MIRLFEKCSMTPSLSKMKGSTGSCARPSQKGFTLIETVMAIGIVVFAMLPILGMVPVGLDNLREAISSTVESQIVQALSNEILLTKYDAVIQKYQAGVTSTYDEEGILLSSTLGGGDANSNPNAQALYTVTVTLKDISVPALNTAETSTCALIEIRRVNSLSKVNQHTLLIPKA